MSLYLKYRPINFENLIGQDFIKETLQKAIENNRTIHSYLFCGPRGTGKTSAARIFAKTINCEKINKGNPCLKCSICKDFLDEKLIDIIEIDAASYTGVDNIREIIEKVYFLPNKTKYKIYIIDEVHMLSKGAFNALLKILEEPPNHIKFILATTETNKIPETIISRCQRYDFKRISDNDIKNRLQFIAKSEKIKVDNKSYSYIIKNSSGGLRNAISLFEQLIFDNEINYDNIVKKLEIVDENIFESFLDKLFIKDKQVIDIFDKIIDNGKNIKLFFKELIFFSKDKTLKVLKNKGDISRYIDILEILDETYLKTKNSLDENITFLIGILKIIQKEKVHNNIINEELKNKQNKIQKEQVQISNKTQKEIKKEISDISDIFNSNFDKDFIEKLKENGAKSGLTVNLKLSSIILNKKILSIKTKTKFAKNAIEKIDNIQCITKSLNDLGFNDIKINLI